MSRPLFPTTAYKPIEKAGPLLWPAGVVAIALTLEYSGWDLRLAKLFYDPVLQLWPWQSHWLTERFLHTGGRFLVVAIGVALLLFLGLTLSHRNLRPYRKGTAFLLAAGLPGPILVAIGKASTHIYSPWDLRIFGGNQPYIRLFDPVPLGVPIGHAFPAGHASGGFCFFGLYFLSKACCPRYRGLGVALPLTLGLVFGLTQQARGAHFLSHDLFSLVICWYSALFMARFFFTPQPPGVQSPE